MSRSGNGNATETPLPIIARGGEMDNVMRLVRHPIQGGDMATLGTGAVGRTDRAAELRAEMARHMVPIYRIASRVGLHPAHLGQALRGRRPLSPEMAERIERALQEEATHGAA
jgi:hypothetical protein